LNTADEVKDEYNAHSNVINQYRGTTDGDAAMQPQPMNDVTVSMDGQGHVSGDEAMSGDEASALNNGHHAHHKKRSKGKKILKGLKQFSKRRFSVDY
jgi:hypothetical protein